MKKKHNAVKQRIVSLTTIIHNFLEKTLIESIIKDMEGSREKCCTGLLNVEHARLNK